MNCDFHEAPNLHEAYIKSKVNEEKKMLEVITAFGKDRLQQAIVLLKHIIGQSSPN